MLGPCNNADFTDYADVLALLAADGIKEPTVTGASFDRFA
jgi:hypothetical protein